MSEHDASGTTGSTGSTGATDAFDNVTFVNFGTRKRVSAPEEVLKVVRSADGAEAGLPPAAGRIMSAVSKQADSGRIKRGRDYARQGHVVGLDVRKGAVHGTVAGSQNEPFAVLMQLPYRTNDDLAEISDILTRTPNALRQAREGKLPDEVVNILLAEDDHDLRFSCTCPDPAPVCKHIIAVADRLAARMDADPSVIFAMRGLSFAALEQAMMDKAKDAARDAFSPESVLSEEERNDLFWNGRELPEVPHPKIAPALADSDMDLLRKAMRSVSHTNIELLRAVSDIEELYEFLTRS